MNYWVHKTDSESSTTIDFSYVVSQILSRGIAFGHEMLVSCVFYKDSN